MCHTADQRARRHLAIRRLQGRPDPDAELVRALADVQPRGGLGDWSIKDITDLLKTGVSTRGVVYGPMAEVVYNSLQYLTDDDITRHGRVPEEHRRGILASRRRLRHFRRTESSLLISLGKTVYDARCASCHGAQGEGKPPHWPPLAGNQSIQMESAVNPIRMVLNGGYPPATEATRSPTACRRSPGLCPTTRSPPWSATSARPGAIAARR